jgi:hypothetical protein
MPLFVRLCLYLLSVRTQLVIHCTLSSHLLNISAVFGHHQVDFKIACMGKNTELDRKETPPPGYSFPFVLLLSLPDDGQKWPKHVVPMTNKCTVF